MISEKFRRQLREEAGLWKAEGLIDDTVYRQLGDRYQFDSLEQAASNRFVVILMGLGGILLGLGAITFVAANWQEWPRSLRVILLLSILVGFDAGGFYLWQHPTSGAKQRLGIALLLCGAVCLGANIALMAQMFHIGGSPYGLYVVWGLGVLAMAYSLQLRSLGVLSLLLLAIGYWLGIEYALEPGEASWIDLLIRHMAIAGAILFVPLAYWCESRLIFVMALLLIISSLNVTMGAIIPVYQLPGLGVALALILPPAVLWAYDDSQWPGIDGRRFRSLARSFALWLLGILFFFLSFKGVWNIEASDFEDILPGSAFLLVDVLIFIALALWQWFRLARPDRTKQYWGVDSVTAAIAGFLAITGIVTFWHISISPIPEIATYIFNILMFLLATGTIRIGLTEGSRAAFWGGMVLLILQIISRLFEYNTELLLKAFVLVLCGIGVIIAGLWFERHLSRQNV
ncbi:DUF2157 domain-containing protein [Lyngbya sp. CCY1209]|uniref:DUF2157 domain-containing protein n=1 Tax=Lyngbya sp. CCY1209 TaxID=2886103 RepID=UPI002D202BE5|nr:DUF2157 domain-containing protein [Lyngbya sp. CCY1209]MEB3881917.1 DUF2157 domain-containing protein [Lyngbya sp. CCY1209]